MTSTPEVPHPINVTEVYRAAITASAANLAEAQKLLDKANSPGWPEVSLEGLQLHIELGEAYAALAHACGNPPGRAPR